MSAARAPSVLAIDIDGKVQAADHCRMARDRQAHGVQARKETG